MSNTDSSIPTHSPRRSIRLLDGNGAKLILLVISLSLRLIVCFAIPKPVEVTKQALWLFAIFLTAIVGLILSPLPMAAWTIVCVALSFLTWKLTFESAFAAFTDEVTWLIMVSFFFSREFVNTGLGDRLEMYFVRWFGRSTLGLAYGMAISEAIISLAIPSTIARAGGLLLPIINSLAITAESRPNDPSARKLGAFLVRSQLQVRPLTTFLL